SAGGPDPRFPQATTYQVEIPAGTKSASGNALAKAVKFTFETPPVKLVSHTPDEYTPQKLDVPVLLTFDQDIDPQAVLAKLSVKVQKNWDGKPIGVHLLDAKEIAADKQLAAVVANAKQDGADRR